MARIKFYGDRLEPGTVGDRQVPQMPATKAAMPPIYEQRWAQNGKSPDARLLSLLNESANQGALFRTKQYWNILGATGGAVASAAGTTVRWRGSFRTGPYVHGAMIMANLLPPDTEVAIDSYATCTIDDGASTVATAEFHYGPNPNGPAAGIAYVSGWQSIRSIIQFVELDPSTAYNFKFSAVDYGKLQSACVIEMQSLTENLNGYAATNITTQTPIVDRYRSLLASMTRSLWTEGGAHVLNWTKDQNAAPATTSATPTNMLDGVSTTVTSSTLGFVLRMTGKKRLSQSGVPVVMKVYGSCTSIGNGNVYLVGQSSGTVVTVGPFVTTAGWKTGTGTLPATEEKFDLYFATGAGTLTIQAVSVYELD